MPKNNDKITATILLSLRVSMGQEFRTGSDEQLRLRISHWLQSDKKAGTLGSEAAGS